MMKFPNLSYEIPLWKQGYSVIGIDEVGRGCLAGPVYVAAVCLERGEIMRRNTSRIEKMQKWGIQDSKKISATKRNKLVEMMRGEGVEVTIAATPVATINRVGIVTATQMAAKNALSKLVLQLEEKRLHILSDAYRINFVSHIGPTPETPIVRGDQKSISIAAASIFAKVARDEHMTQLSEGFPDYYWHQNKGYGTKAHQHAILNLGPTIHHREIFIKKLVNTTKNA